MKVRLATRRSALAQAQARLVVQRLPADVEVEVVFVATEGDLRPDTPIAELDVIGAFVGAIQGALLAGDADIAVHSAKDLPGDSPAGLAVMAFVERAPVFDVMVGSRLDRLPSGAIVGVGGPRRTTQLLLLRPDVITVEVRGNVDSRLRRLDAGHVDALVLAEAGLMRLGVAERLAQRFTVDEMMPAACQGALAVETRADDQAMQELVMPLDDRSVRVDVEAERRVVAHGSSPGCASAWGAFFEEWGGGVRAVGFASGRRAPVHGSVVADDHATAEARLVEVLST